MKNSNITKFNYLSNLANITSVDDILAELGTHEKVLTRTEIGSLIYFSRTYAVINHNIEAAAVSGSFENPDSVRLLQLNFAFLYFEVLNNYTVSGNLPKQWQRAVNHTIRDYMPSELSLYYAIKAHVVCDATRSLLSLNIPPSVLSSDYSQIDMIIRNSTTEVLSSYNPNESFRRVRRLTRVLFAIPVCYIIRGWRDAAWKSFMREYAGRG